MNETRLAWAGLTSAMTAVWVAIALSGGDGSPVDTTAAGAAAAAATAVLIGAGWPARSLGTLQAGGLLLVGAPLAVAAAPGGSTAPLAFLLALVAAAELATAVTGQSPEGRRQPFWSAKGGRTGPGRLTSTRRTREAAATAAGRQVSWSPAVTGGCALVVAALVVERVDAARWALPGGDSAVAVALAVGGASLLVLAAAFGPSRAWALAVASLAVALPAAGHLPGTAGVAAAAAVVAAGVAPRRPTLALAALAVAAAASSASLGPVAPLLAAAAVLALVVDHPAAAALGLPAAAALAAQVVPPGRSASAVALAAAVALSALVVAARAGDPSATAATGPPAVPAVEALPALALGAWLVLAPGTWGWTGAEGHSPYDRGAAVALAAGLLAAVATAAGRRRPVLSAAPAPSATPTRAPVAAATPASDRRRRPTGHFLRPERPAPQPPSPAPAPDEGPVVVPAPARRRARLRPASPPTGPPNRADG